MMHAFQKDEIKAAIRIARRTRETSGAGIEVYLPTGPERDRCAACGKLKAWRIRCLTLTYWPGRKAGGTPKVVGIAALCGDCSMKEPRLISRALKVRRDTDASAEVLCCRSATREGVAERSVRTSPEGDGGVGVDDQDGSR